MYYLSLFQVAYSFVFLFPCTMCSVHQITLLSSLGTSLVALVVPVSIGMFVNHKWPQKAKIILKVSVPGYRLQTNAPQ